MSLKFGTRLLLAPWLLFSLALSEEEPRGEILNVSEVSRTFQWNPADLVEVYYAEFLLSQWVLERSPWNAYHSAIGFKNLRTNDKVLFDFAPADTSSVMKAIVPEVKVQSAVRAIVGEYELKWVNGAVTHFETKWRSRYKNWVKLGNLNASIFQVYADWVEGEYKPRYREFQPLEVAIAGEGVRLRSRMCHDFVTDSLWSLYDNGAQLAAVDTIFRDHIIMYASHVDPIELEGVSRHSKRLVLRYFRSVALYLEAIKEQFTNGRMTLANNFKLGIPAYMHTQHADYSIQLAAPFLNYCYLPLAVPPKVHDPFDSVKLCALGLEANLTNSTAPFPWGAMLATEARMDRWEVPLALIFVAAASACLPWKR